MKTVFEIVYQRMKSALGVKGLKGRVDIAAEGQRTEMSLKRQGETRYLRGKLNWEGDLDSLRQDRRSSD